jgi:hypothetical protein
MSKSALPKAVAAPVEGNPTYADVGGATQKHSGVEITRSTGGFTSVIPKAIDYSLRESSPC